MNNIQFTPIGTAYLTSKGTIPKRWSIAEMEGTLVLDEAYRDGLHDVRAGQRMIVVFYFHRSPAFTPDNLTQALPHVTERRGVFSLRSPLRPNPIGVSVVEVLRVEGNILYVKGMDLFDGTPILDLKPDTEPPV